MRQLTSLDAQFLRMEDAAPTGTSEGWPCTTRRPLPEVS